MNTSLLAGTLLFLAVCPATGTAQSDPAAPAPAPRTEYLRLYFPVGQTLYYSLTEDTIGTSLEAHGKPTRINSHLEMHLHQTVTGLQASDSAGLIEIGIDSLTVTVDKKPTPPTDSDLAAMADMVKLVVLPNGKLESALVNPALNVSEALTGEDPAHLNALAGLGVLPETPLKVGDTWKSPVFQGMEGEQTTADLTLTGWEKQGAASIAVIKQALHGKFGTPAADTAQPPGELKIAGGEFGTRTVRFNVEAGTVQSEESLVYLNAVLTTCIEQHPPTTTRMWVKVTSKMVQTDAPPPKTP